MKLFGAVAVLAAATGGWASEAGRIPQRVVTACLNPDGRRLLYQGMDAATRVLKPAGIALKWRNNERACIAAGNGIVVTVSFATREDQYPHAFAYAMPFERTHLVLFYDRVRLAVSPEVVPRLLGHVLAHEIVHMLQGLIRHSASGVMKPHWDHLDYAEMMGFRLKFTNHDIDLIHRGLEERASYTAPVSDRRQYDNVHIHRDDPRANAANRGVVPPGR